MYGRAGSGGYDLTHMSPGCDGPVLHVSHYAVLSSKAMPLRCTLTLRSNMHHVELFTFSHDSWVRRWA